MNFLPQSFTFRRTRSNSGPRSHVVPVRDVQWGRPIFRAPELPAYPRLRDAVPFTAMRPLRPTGSERPEPGS